MVEVLLYIFCFVAIVVLVAYICAAADQKEGDRNAPDYYAKKHQAELKRMEKRRAKNARRMYWRTHDGFGYPL